MDHIAVTRAVFPTLTKLAATAEPIPLTAEKEDRVRSILESTDTSATGVFRATQSLLGNAFHAWEPESIWLELDDRGIDLPELNRAKILSLSTLLQVPAFYWDANVFENTALACASEPVLPDILQEASPAQLTWAVYECEMLLQSTGEDPDFDYEPAKYAAVSMHRAGLVWAPELLQFAQEELDKLNRSHVADLKDEVRKGWEKLEKGQLEEHTFEETPLDVQLARLAAIQLYFDTCLQQYQADLQLLAGVV